MTSPDGKVIVNFGSSIEHTPEIEGAYGESKVSIPADSLNTARSRHSGELAGLGCYSSSVMKKPSSISSLDPRIQLLLD
jgi:hypothetical protein